MNFASGAHMYFTYPCMWIFLFYLFERRGCTAIFCSHPKCLIWPLCHNVPLLFRLAVHDAHSFISPSTLFVVKLKQYENVGIVFQKIETHFSLLSQYYQNVDMQQMKQQP